MNYSKYVIFKVILILLCPFSYTYAKNFTPTFETNRLKSTAGTGVGSLLIDEANHLNPASSAFFNIGSIYLQKTNSETTSPTGQQQSLVDNSDQVNFIASDAKGRSSGSLSYSKYSSGEESIKSFGLSMATPVSEKSSIGSSVTRQTEELLNENNILEKQTFNIMTFGVTHLVSERLSLGLVLKDAFRKKENNTRVLTGIQYLVGDYITLMADIGTDYKDKLGDKFVWRGATQLRVLNDFYTRFGMFNDRGNMTEGTGIGVGWVQPKLTIEASLKNTEVKESLELGQSAEDIKESTLSLSYRF